MNKTKNKNIASRSGIIIFNKDNILLMYRQKNGKEFYTFPGGTVEVGESIESAAIRELYEETSIIAESIRILYRLKIIDIPGEKLGLENALYCKDEYFTLCEYVSGEPSLQANAIEHQRINNNNIYKPIWVLLNDIKNMLLYPLEIRDLLVSDIELEFSFDRAKDIKIQYSKKRNR